MITFFLPAAADIGRLRKEESMSDLTLPVRASLRHIKNEAKQLHKALLAGDGEAASMIRIGLPRLGRRPPSMM